MTFSEHEAHVWGERRRLGARAAYNELIAANDALIRGARLDNGREIATARAAIHTGLVGEWAAAQHQASGYDRSFAVVALGGTGRGELAPCSDKDFAFLFDDAVEGNAFLLHLQQQTLHSPAFRDEHGFEIQVMPFNLEDVQALEGKQLNAFLDMRAVYDPAGLVPVFRERIHATYDPFEHFLHVRGFWIGRWAKAAAEFERLDRFDIKNDGLRVFLAGIWTLAGKHLLHSEEVYAALEDPRDLEAYDLLMRLRAFVHWRRQGVRSRPAGGDHPEDILEFDDFLSFGELLGPDAGEQARFEFANDVRARLLAARRRVAQFAKGVIESELKEGRPVAVGSTIFYGVGGLAQRVPRGQRSLEEKSRAALALLLAAQHFRLPIDPTELTGTFRNAGDWLGPVPELAALFQEERGSLADSYEFLAQLEGAEERLFPGYGRFESSLDGRVLTERKSLRSAFEREKTRALERMVTRGRERLERRTSTAEPTELGRDAELEAARLDEVHLVGVKLALKTKRLPLTAEDLAARADTSLPLHERAASGFSEIPLEAYYQFYAPCGFSAAALEVARFLVANRRAFKQLAPDPNDADKVDEFVTRCGTEQRLRALFVFTRADRESWESEKSDPVRWWSTRELYAKAMEKFQPGPSPIRLLTAAGFSAEQARILDDLGSDFHGGLYRRFASRFGEHLVRLAMEPATAPLVRVIQDGASTILVVAARDYPGLAATITGTLWRAGVNLRQAHLFSARQHGLALDFLHVSAATPISNEVARTLAQAIERKLYLAESDEAELPLMTGATQLREWRPGQLCLRFQTAQDSGGLVYALAYRVFRHLRGNIFSLSANASRGTAFVSVYFTLPSDLNLEAAETIVAEKF